MNCCWYHRAMALPKDYAGQRCSLSRALEVVGERWTLLIMRDAFFGVRRFGDFAAHLGVPRAVLTERLESLREAGVLAETRGSHGYGEYVLTGKGLSLWPVVRDLLSRGDEYYSRPAPGVPACPGRGHHRAGRNLRRLRQRGSAVGPAAASRPWL